MAVNSLSPKPYEFPPFLGMVETEQLPNEKLPGYETAAIKHTRAMIQGRNLRATWNWSDKRTATPNILGKEPCQLKEMAAGKAHKSWRKKNLSSKPNQTHKKPSWAICSLAQILKNEAQKKWSNSPNKEELRTTKKMTPQPSKREGKKWPQESLLWWHPQWFSNALVFFFLINIDLWTKLVNIYIYTRNFGP